MFLIIVSNKMNGQTRKEHLIVIVRIEVTWQPPKKMSL
jgi:hypothetical protein